MLNMGSMAYKRASVQFTNAEQPLEDNDSEEAENRKMVDAASKVCVIFGNFGGLKLHPTGPVTPFNTPASVSYTTIAVPWSQ